MYTRIARHGAQLLNLYPNAPERDPVRLCKQLRRVEAIAHKLAEDCCNYLSMESPEFNGRHEQTMIRLLRVLGLGGPEVHINLDARGYALKIDSDHMSGIELHKDWGGNGIIAPDFTPNN
jgi:hypothetical protein